VALVRIEGHSTEMRMTLLRHHQRVYDPLLKRTILNIRQQQRADLGRLADLARQIALVYATAVNETLMAAGYTGTDLAAVAAHGQTLFHDPPLTIQWFDPALLAVEVDAPVVSDFRRADCAMGGQGAPLVPFADYVLFRHATKPRVLVNIGGIANLTYLPPGERMDSVMAFDTGPGNCLSDYIMRQRGPGIADGVDWEGKVAAEGKIVEELVREVMASPYFQQPPPKTTDGPSMIQIYDMARGRIGTDEVALEDELKTACTITSRLIIEAVERWLPRWPDELILSGGGTKNTAMMKMLSERITVKTTDEYGVPSVAKEAMAFALLGAATLDGVPGNLPSATGARRGVVLGSITPRP
jgi:anhydro-N-acetylmuramic acid kinase